MKPPTKYYLGIEERWSMGGDLISEIHLLVERSAGASKHSIFERMFIVSQHGNFEADIEFRFESPNAFQVINKTENKAIGHGICVGPYDSPSSMVDTITIEQTKERATAVFSFDGPRIFVGKTYCSMESGEQTGFSVEKCTEIDKEAYDRLKSHPQNMPAEWQKNRLS